MQDRRDPRRFSESDTSNLVEREPIVGKMYRPPEGINPEPFERVPFSHAAFLVDLKNPERYEEVDTEVLELASQAVLDTTQRYTERRTSVDPDTVRSVVRERDFERYITEYATGVNDALEVYIHSGKSVAVACVPIGGMAPLHAVMKMAVERGLRLDNVTFLPYVPKDEYGGGVVKNHDAVILVDDGMASMSTQLRILYGKMPHREYQVDDAIHEIKVKVREKGTCAHSDLRGQYQRIMQVFAGHNIVNAPEFSKNPLVYHVAMEHAKERLAHDPNDTWARAQIAYYDAFHCEYLEEDREYPGGAVDGLPCRDIGVELGDPSIRELLHPSVLQRMFDAGFDKDTTFRLLGDRQVVVSMGQEQVDGIIAAFVRSLDKRFRIKDK